MLLVILTKKKSLESFTKKELQETNQNEFSAEKLIKRKCDKLYIKCKGYDNFFNSWIDKKDTVKMSEYFPKTKSLGGSVKVELYLSNYATKEDLKNTAGVDTSDFAKKTDLANLKFDVAKLDI